ncbi:MAG: DUF3881 family protein [Lachnospiraceae bacterium]|nr:DUF3881 family protein [Lachnospiraceae bacterium]
MHSFLKAIGYGNLTNHKEEQALIQTAIKDAQEQCIYADENMRMAELSFEVAPGVGIVVRGEYDADEQFHMEHYFPYLKGTTISTQEEIFISKRVDTEAYTGMCDDFRLGVSLIFYLQNAVDYMKADRNAERMIHPVVATGLAKEGKILLPVKQDIRAEKIMNADLTQRSKLIAEAKKGNQEAIESLTLDDIDLYSMVSKRIQKEDIYSIVNTSFIPYGSESDNYTVLGIIENVRYEKNSQTGEEICILQLYCNQMEFEICINRKDLLGEPLVGRRFRGIVWMQGYVDFNA